VAIIVRFFDAFTPLASRASVVSVNSVDSSALGVGHEPEPLPDVRRPEATSWQYDRPAGVTFRLHCIEYSIGILDMIKLIARGDCIHL
jgi:hypothetical protein